MSNTRKTNDNFVLHQNRYASSQEFERGLLANLVAKRAALLDRREDRELLWAAHFLSHQEGGLAAVARELLARYPGRIGTETMLKSGKKDSQNFSADEIRKIRLELPLTLCARFLLKGETKTDLRAFAGKYERLAGQSDTANALREMADEALANLDSYEGIVTGAREEREKQARAEAATHPTTYSVTALREFCRRVAMEGLDVGEQQWHNLERQLAEMCLNPEWDITAGGPWYFTDLCHTLQDYMKAWIAQKAAGIVVTALGTVVHETLDYTLHSKSMTLVEGDARTGKTFAARSWCEQHPGQTRFVEVPTGNDDKTFFRALARGLGLGNFQQYKALEIRERVECVLLTGDILLCLDEGHRLWPEINLTRGFPKRINWVMSMANQNVPICIVATPQFVERQIASRQFAGWNDAQFIGRLGHRERLPSELSVKDLVAVAKSVLPEADATTLHALAAYARTSARYLAAIDTITRRARYIAGRAGRSEVMADDVRKAMKESVIPSDTMLVRALEKTKPRRYATLPTPAAAPDTETSVNRNPRNDLVRNSATNRIADLVEH
jgi:histone H3/H4